MKKINKNDIKSFMTLNFDFAGTRIMEKYIFPVEWKLKVNLVAVDYGSDRTHKEMHTASGITYQKLHFWLESCLPDVVMLDSANEVGMLVVSKIDNIMMHCPGDPTDDLLVRLIHAKLSSIAGDNILIKEVYLESNDSSASYTFALTDIGYDLPATVKEYVNLRSLHTTPWWARNDGFSFEFLAPAEGDIAPEEIFKNVSDPLQEFENALLGGFGMITEVMPTDAKDNKPAQIIQLDKWKPKIVE
jgi:hypothetical protein